MSWLPTISYHHRLDFQKPIYKKVFPTFHFWGSLFSRFIAPGFKIGKWVPSQMEMFCPICVDSCHIVCSVEPGHRLRYGWGRKLILFQGSKPSPKSRELIASQGAASGLKDWSKSWPVTEETACLPRPPFQCSQGVTSRTVRPWFNFPKMRARQTTRHQEIKRKRPATKKATAYWSLNQYWLRYFQ